jgi:3-hydroxyacyl-[acyl-carrier-protein] dehydratase
MNLEYFELIDRITHLDLPEKAITVEAVIPLTSTIFEGHFPGRPLMPGVLLIEAMAQTSGWLLIGVMNFERMPFLAAVKEAKMRNFVQPGQKLEITARVAHEGSGFAMTEAEIRIAGKRVCSASLTFTHVPFPNEDLRGHMAVVAERVGLPKPVRANG